MEQKLIARSQKSEFITMIIILGIIMILGFIYLININFKTSNSFDENSKIASFLALGSIVIYLIFHLLNQKRIFVYENYFEIKRLFKLKRYHFKDIKTHYSEYFEGKYNSWTEYYLVLNNDVKITFIDSEYVNFNEFFKKITANIKQDTKLNALLKQPNFLKYGIITILISGVFFYFSSFFYDFDILKNNRFKYFTATMQDEMIVGHGSKNSKYLLFHLKEYPSYEFKILSFYYYNINNKAELISNFKPGEKIIVGIDKEDYDKKISCITPLNLVDQYLRYSTIHVKQLMDKNKRSYIDLKGVSDDEIENNYMGIGFFSIFGIVLIYVAFGNFRSYYKLSSKADHLKKV